MIDPDQGQDAGDELGHPFVEHIADVVDIIGQAAHQLAMRSFIKITQRQDLHLGEQVLAQIAHGMLGHARHDIGLQPGR